MKLKETPLSGAFVIEPDVFRDERGWFVRMWCAREFEELGLNPNLAQINHSHSRHRGTLRGMHFQHGPHAQVKIVRCSKGRLYDVIIDLRPESETYTEHFGIELSEDAPRMLYVPEGFAHGFLTLEDHTEIHYEMTEFYHPESEDGVRWDDPAFGINWPDSVRVMNERDRTFPDFKRRA